MSARLLSVVATLMAFAGCALLAPPKPADDCAVAQELLQDCGATLPLLTDGPCTGLRVALAECVLDQTPTCDSLASLGRRPDTCAPELAELTGLGPPTGPATESVFNRPADAGTQDSGGDQ